MADPPRSVPPKIRLVAGGRAHSRKEGRGGGAFAVARARGGEWCVVWRGREDRRAWPPHADGRGSSILRPIHFRLALSPTAKFGPIGVELARRTNCPPPS